MNLHPEITAHLCSASEWTPAMKEYMTLWNQHNKLLNCHHKMVKRVGMLEAELQANTSMMASYKEMMAKAQEQTASQHPFPTLIFWYIPPSLHMRGG